MSTGEHPLVVDRSFDSDAEYASYLIHKRAYEEAARRFAGKAVCDWGCSIGYGTGMLLSTAASVDALDTSPRAVAIARERLGPLGVKVHLLQGARSPYPDRTFGGVTSFQVVEHVDDVPAYLREIHRILAADGAALFTTPNSLLRLHPGQKPWNPHHVREFSAQQLDAMLRPHFSSVQILGMFGRGKVDMIERARVTRARDAAQAWLPPEWRVRVRAVCIDAVKAVLPARVLSSLRQLRDNFGEEPSQRSNRRGNYDHSLSTEELYYADKNLEGALDLLAICQP
jgi:2-polyprenyl-3-methyl-5-hydroxy-6-metoxy-1,4-benzoquinol methylase